MVILGLSTRGSAGPRGQAVAGGEGELSRANQATNQLCYHPLCDLGQVSQLP